MAVDVIMGYGSGENSNALQEAASAGIHSVEKLMNMISQQQQQQEKTGSEIGTIADVAVNKFREVISILDKSKTIGHARFRRAPPSTPPSPSTVPLLQLQQTVDSDSNANSKAKLSSSILQQVKTEQVSAFKAYLRPPPPPPPPPPAQNHHHPFFEHPQKTQTLVEEPHGSVRFSISPSVSATLTGDTQNLQRPCGSSKPPLSSTSLKRKSNSMDFPRINCGSSSTQCHCSKKRYFS